MAEIKLPKIALGAWAWGNDATFGSGIAADELKPIFDAAMDAGLNLWDTAYAYGMGTSEKVLAGFLEGLPRESYLVSDKLEVLNSKLAAIAEAHGVGIAQIPVAWAIAKGTLPIVGVTKVAHVEDAARAAAVELSPDDIADLERVADSLGIDAVRFWEKAMD